MISKQRLKIIICGIASAVLVSLAVAVDSYRLNTAQTAAGLMWARQVMSQLEGLELQYREAGKTDAIATAIQTLAQGVEPRVIRIIRVEVQNDSDPNQENFSFHRKTGNFDYFKLLVPEKGVGVRLTLSLGYTGFLGTRSRLVSDLLVFTSFFLIFGCALLASRRSSANEKREHVDTVLSGAAGWAKAAKAQLVQLSVQIREMVRHSQRLATSSRKSQTLVGDLRGKIHAGLNTLHQERRTLLDAESAAARAEGLALRMALEANRVGDDAKPLLEIMNELHGCLNSMRSAARQNHGLLLKMEKQIEPWSTDADLAFHTFDEVAQATQALQTHIRGTTELLIGQARLHRELEPETPLVVDPGAEKYPLPEPLPSLQDTPTPATIRLRKGLERLHKKKAG
ncbi:hypothetical protein WDW37_01720 [Bdellovibrionota bacterium FG-1]